MATGNGQQVFCILHHLSDFEIFPSFLYTFFRSSMVQFTYNQADQMHANNEQTK